jgi:hypothetical protein
MIATLKFEDLRIQYQLFDVLPSAKFALRMQAIGKNKELIFWIFLVANQT